MVVLLDRIIALGDTVLQFPDIARPAVVDQNLHGLRIDFLNRLYVLPGKHPDEMIHQQADVVSAFAQRRHPDRYDLDPVEKIFQKPAGFDFRMQIQIGGSNDPHVHIAGCGAAHRLKGHFLILGHQRGCRKHAGGGAGNCRNKPQRRYPGESPQDSRYRYVFGTGRNTKYLADALNQIMKYLHTRFGLTLVYILTQNMAWARSTAAIMIKLYFDGMSWQALGTDQFAYGASDFSSSLKKPWQKAPR